MMKAVEVAVPVVEATAKRGTAEEEVALIESNAQGEVEAMPILPEDIVVPVPSIPAPKMRLPIFN